VTRATVWNEHLEEREHRQVGELYPEGIHAAVAEGLRELLGDRELLWTVEPGHRIARGVRNPVVIPRSEMYGEPFDIPPPDELVFVSSFEGGEVFRSGCCFRRGRGRVFFFGPGHEEYPVYRQPEIRRILANAVRWAHRRPPPVRPGDSVERPRGWYEDKPGGR
jgi:trehalose utilization protein